MQIKPPILMLSLLLLTSTCTANELIGQTTPPYPDHWQEEGGSCLLDCNYSLGVLIKGQQRLWYLGKKSPQSTANKPRWQILDTMPYPEPPEGYELTYSTCENQGTPDPSLIALVKTADTEWLDQLRFVYKANIAKGSFETISTQGVRCENLAAGL